MKAGILNSFANWVRPNGWVRGLRRASADLAAILRSLTRPATKWFNDQSLSRQFAFASAAVIILGMAAIGNWVARKIEEGVTNTSAAAATLYMDAIVAPLVQELADGSGVSAGHRQQLRDVMMRPEISSTIVSIKVWAKDGTIAFSTFENIVGKRYAATSDLLRAWEGHVSADFDNLHHEDDHAERGLHLSLLEIYAPIREVGSNRIIAVSEFYVRADSLAESLLRARIQSGAVVAATALAMILALYLIVRRGSRTIRQQQAALSSRAVQNAELRARIERAYWRADKLNEQYLRRLGSDLHDGPAQLLGFALMSLDNLPLDKTADFTKEIETQREMIYRSLEDAIKEIRNLSRGLILPELADTSVGETAALVARLHKERTGSDVELVLPAQPLHAPIEITICIYRFIQEALSNAFKHAKGAEQRVEVALDRQLLTVSVQDKGPGMMSLGEPNHASTTVNQLGLLGIRNRVETLAGQFEIIRPPAGGTLLRVTIDIAKPLKIGV